MTKKRVLFYARLVDVGNILTGKCRLDSTGQCLWMHLDCLFELNVKNESGDNAVGGTHYVKHV